MEFGAAQRVDPTASAGELCGLMLVFQDAIPYTSVESPGWSDQQQERRSRKWQRCRWL
jgi:hypothetical protein